MIHEAGVSRGCDQKLASFWCDDWVCRLHHHRRCPLLTSCFVLDERPRRVSEEVRHQWRSILEVKGWRKKEGRNQATEAKRDECSHLPFAWKVKEEGMNQAIGPSDPKRPSRRRNLPSLRGIRSISFRQLAFSLLGWAHRNMQPHQVWAP